MGMALHKLFKSEEKKSVTIQRIITAVNARDQTDEKMATQLRGCHMMVQGSENMLSDHDKAISSIKRELEPYTQRWLGIRANLIFAANNELKVSAALDAKDMAEVKRLRNKIEEFHEACDELNVDLGDGKSIISLHEQLEKLMRDHALHMNSIEENYHEAYTTAQGAGIMVAKDLTTGAMSVVDKTLPNVASSQKKSL